jgi:hypothetical protein
VDKDYLGLDSRRGFHQFNDCLILQMLSGPDDALWAGALGPLHDKRNAESIAKCASLHTLVREGTAAHLYPMGRYTRYWHGYNPLAAGLLGAVDLWTARKVLKIGVYGALVLLGLAAGTQPRGLAAIACAISVTGLLFWALPYFGQSLAHAPGDMFVVLSLSCLLFGRQALSRRGTLVPFCAVYGAGVVYFEFLHGQVPIVLGILLPATYLMARLRPGEEREPARSWRFGLTGCLAFAAGGALTVAVKQILVAAIIGPGAARSVVEHLNRWTSSAPGDPPLWAPLKSVARVLREGPVLTYGSREGAIALGVAAALAWSAAGYLALRARRGGALSDLLAFAAGAGIVPAWIWTFQAHTAVHKTLMVRMLIVPLSLGWGALAWQVVAPPVRSREAPAEQEARGS